MAYPKQYIFRHFDAVFAYGKQFFCDAWYFHKYQVAVYHHTPYDSHCLPHDSYYTAYDPHYIPYDSYHTSYDPHHVPHDPYHVPHDPDNTSYGSYHNSYSAHYYAYGTDYKTHNFSHHIPNKAHRTACTGSDAVDGRMGRDQLQFY